jgi:regulator of sigma E protease
LSILISVLIGLVGLGIVVFIHELGHFVAARLVGVEVEAFAVGWGPAFFRWKPRSTEYRLCWLPLGGYCKMKGEAFLVQALSDPVSTPVPEKGSFFAASPWRRILISLAGPLFNLFSALLVLTVLAATGVPQSSPEARIVLASTIDHRGPFPADQAGLQTGDWIQSINGKKILNFHDLQTAILQAKAGPDVMQVQRDGKPLTLTVHPRWETQAHSWLVGVYPWIDPVVKTVVPNSAAQIAGILPGDRILALNSHPTPYTEAIADLLNDRSPTYNVVLQRGEQKITTTLVPDIVHDQPRLGLAYALPHYPATPEALNTAVADGWNQTWSFLSQMVDGLVQLVTGKLDPAQSLSGPILIAYYVGETASQSFLSGWGEGVGAIGNFLSFISLALFLMNLLPLPALDGGNVALNFVEIIRRKAWQARTLVRFQQVGVFFIFILIVFTTYNNLAFLLAPK